MANLYILYVFNKTIKITKNKKRLLKILVLNGHQNLFFFDGQEVEPRIGINPQPPHCHRMLHKVRVLRGSKFATVFSPKSGHNWSFREAKISLLLGGTSTLQSQILCTFLTISQQVQNKKVCSFVFRALYRPTLMVALAA